MARSKAPSPMKWMWVAIGLFLALLGASLMTGVTLTVQVSEVEAQKLLDAQLVKLRAKKPAYDIEYVTVHFVDNHMTVEAAGGYKKQMGTFPELAVTAALKSVGTPAYRDGGIYFLASDFSLDTFLLNGEEPSVVIKREVDTLAAEKLPQLRDKILAPPKVTKWLDKLGVSVDKAKNNLAIAAAGSTVDGLVDEYRKPVRDIFEKEVREILETTPLYTLGKNFKEKVALAALSDISIKDGVLTATLTGLRLLWTLLTGILVVAFVLVFVLLGVSVYRRSEYRASS